MSKRRKRQASCVTTYIHVLEKWADWEKKHPSATPEDKALELGDICRRTIDHHLGRCLGEAGRSRDKAKRRYAWDTGRGVMYLWVPRAVSIKRLLAVLHRELPDADAGRAGEKERAQAIVDAWFPGRWVSFDINCIAAPAGTDPVSTAMRNEIKACALIQVVAIGMAASIERQRPSIRALGPERLQQLVTRILEDHLSGTYKPNAVAREYGLQPSNLSHFAPKKWRLGRKTPDLWAYVLEVVKRYPALIGALEESAPTQAASVGASCGNKTGTATDAEDVDPGIRDKIAALLDRISATGLAAHVDRRVLLATQDQVSWKSSRDFTENFMNAISQQYAALLQSGGSPTISPDAPAVREDAVALVDRAFQRSGGYSGALAEAKQIGPTHALNAMIERFRSEARLMYAHRVFREVLGPLSWEDKTAMVKAFLAKAGPLLPPEIRSRSLESLVLHYESLVEAYVRSIDKVKELCRTL